MDMKSNSVRLCLENVTNSAHLKYLHFAHSKRLIKLLILTLNHNSNTKMPLKCRIDSLFTVRRNCSAHLKPSSSKHIILQLQQQGFFNIAFGLNQCVA